MLNDKQKEAVLHEGTALLILAGAGSGKTRVITSKIVWLLSEKKLDPFSILAVTFTNRAAAEMRDRVEAMTGHSGGVMIRTFHSFGSWILRKYGHVLGIPSTYTIYDDEDSLSLLQNIYPGLTKKELKPFSSMISRAKDYALLPDDDLSGRFNNEKLVQMYIDYQARLDRIGNADFGDLIVKPLRILEQFPDIRSEIQARFRVILVDEYQDSNIAQDKFLRMLASQDSYVCVVGDDDQSIYGFRGAEVDNILSFPKRFPGTDIIRLEQNYRSTQPILDLAGAVVENNRGRLGKTLWTDMTEGRKPEFRRLLNQEEEAEYCLELLGDHNYEGTAILYRTNSQSMAFESLFLRKGVPYRVVGAIRFYEREEIKDMLSYMAFFCNMRDEIAFRRIVNKPSRGLGPASQDQVVAAASETEGDLLRAAEKASEDLKGKRAKGLGTFITLIRESMEKLETGTLSDFLKGLAESSGLLDHYREVDEDSLSAKSDNLGQLISAAGDYRNGIEGLQAFLEDVELDRSRMADRNTSVKGVTLITMHNTKGLEFDRVIITGLDDGLFPDSRGLADREALEEERRIFYVSITRAKTELHLLSARSRFLWGRRQFYERSRFLDEIPQDLFSSASDPLQQEDYTPGMFVFHEEYGNGQVVKTWHNGASFLVMVQFASGKQGTFVPKYQPLEKISGDDW
ncbi:MAG: UvrD-helicase domain-containing protein [Spirochaetales bacterium]|nr:UvrD-helicase domain-containing protein [Spirochaetales bacterium]